MYHKFGSRQQGSAPITSARKSLRVFTFEKKRTAVKSLRNFSPALKAKILLLAPAYSYFPARVFLTAAQPAVALYT